MDCIDGESLSNHVLPGNEDSSEDLEGGSTAQYVREHYLSQDGSEWVELPTSLVQKLHNVTRRTGLCAESIVWDAVDFYIEQKIYDWIRPDLAGKHPQEKGETRSRTGVELSEEMSFVIREVALRHSMTTDEVIYHALKNFLEESGWEIIKIEVLKGGLRHNAEPSPTH